MMLLSIILATLAGGMASVVAAAVLSFTVPGSVDTGFTDRVSPLWGLTQGAKRAA